MAKTTGKLQQDFSHLGQIPSLGLHKHPPPSSHVSTYPYTWDLHCPASEGTRDMQWCPRTHVPAIKLKKKISSFPHFLFLSVQSLVSTVKSWVAGFVAALKCGTIIILEERRRPREGIWIIQLSIIGRELLFSASQAPTGIMIWLKWKQVLAFTVLCSLRNRGLEKLFKKLC